MRLRQEVGALVRRHHGVQKENLGALVRRHHGVQKENLDALVRRHHGVQKENFRRQHDLKLRNRKNANETKNKVTHPSWMLSRKERQSNFLIKQMPGFLCLSFFSFSLLIIMTAHNAGTWHQRMPTNYIARIPKVMRWSKCQSF